MANSVIVVKVGTSSVTTPQGTVDIDALGRIARDIAALREKGTHALVVTSGAITAGWSQIGAGKVRPTDTLLLQAVSAVGQPLLMDAWREAFEPYGLAVAQVLLAPSEFRTRGLYLQARATLESLDLLGAVTIINENDAVVDEEIRYGDNDRLAALVANMVGASHLVLLTDTSGLLTADPRLDPTATLIEEVRAVEEVESFAGESSSGVGSGGMSSKLAAARMATWSGIETVIAPAKAEFPVISALSGSEGHGTTFVARTDRLAARKSWIAFAVASHGQVSINQGAMQALENHGRSLLRVGTTGFTGSFEEGDAVDILGPEGQLIAKGLTRVSSEHFSDSDDVVVHRDDLVLLRKA
jgi:glutamate 5-kinase